MDIEWGDKLKIKSYWIKADEAIQDVNSSVVKWIFMYCKVHKLTLQYQILINCKSTDVNFVTWIYELKKQQSRMKKVELNEKRRWWWEWRRLTLNFLLSFSHAHTVPSFSALMSHDNVAVMKE